MKPSLICAMLLALAASACGNKGPLFIPQRPAAEKSAAKTATPPAAPASTPADDSKAPASGAKPWL